ncbi:tyrosine-type recombinase/integrase [Pantoea agglomerans]|uniref:tyrosine-type recombinase/integrase n=1 Tax=Enterobacter agglomerans TaxID=549 RepID=UPI0017823691|nr:integrase arm-type DNA-binding domain-containing protein [Pantoea agglomerans]MBD8152263.1 tyrosine-type recombinase/integrase [Pantoea agglomerans]MBD8231441.1 tyrosine-type recombinase/integrase [Pantoea agglomerans]
MTVKPLTHTEVKNARPQEKDYSMFDGFGLLLYVSRTGCKTWRFRYVHPITSKRQTYTIGGYPQFSLAEARAEREELRKLVARGIDPSDVKKEKVLEQRRSKAQTVEILAQEWLEMKRPGSRRNTQKSKKQIVSHVNRMFGREPIGKLTAVGVIERLRAYAERPSLRDKIIQILNNIMDYAVNSGVISVNPLAKITKAFPAVRVTHLPTLSRHELPAFMAFWNSAPLVPAVRLALKFQIATMVRPGEARQALWPEIDLEKRLWEIPSDRMKSGRPHAVPLSDYALAVLADARKWRLSGSDLVFPSLRKAGMPVSSSTTQRVIHDSEFGRRIVPHGFRSLASTILNEEGFHPDVIEAALAHKSGDAIRDIYNRTTYLEKRRVVMDWWGKFLEAVERGEILETTGDKGLRLIG